MATRTAAQQAEIDKLKADLRAGNLTQEEINRKVTRIQYLGGAINLANFPPATDAPKTTTTTQPTTGTGIDPVTGLPGGTSPTSSSGPTPEQIAAQQAAEAARLQAEEAARQQAAQAEAQRIAQEQAAAQAAAEAEARRVAEAQAAAAEQAARAAAEAAGNPTTTLPPTNAAPIAQLPGDKVDTPDIYTVPVLNPNDTAPDVSDPNGKLVDTINPAQPGLNEINKAAVEQMKAILTMGEDYGRKIGDEFYKEGSLGRLSENLTPAEMAALQAAHDLQAEAGLQSAEVRDLLAQQQKILGDAREFSPLELEALGVARNALQGLDSRENQALREMAREQVLRESRGQARQLAASQARNQVFGSAATAQNRMIGQDAVRETRNLERDLVVKNIEEKRYARDQFANLTGQTEAARAGRTNAASQQFAGTTLADEEARRQAKASATTQYGNLSGSQGDTIRKLKEFNLGQAAAEKAGLMGSIFGGMGLVTGQRGLLAGEEFAGKQYEEQQALMEKFMPEIIKMYKAQIKQLGG